MHRGHGPSDHRPETAASTRGRKSPHSRSAMSPRCAAGKSAKACPCTAIPRHPRLGLRPTGFQPYLGGGRTPVGTILAGQKVTSGDPVASGRGRERLAWLGGRRIAGCGAGVHRRPLVLRILSRPPARDDVELRFSIPPPDDDQLRHREPVCRRTAARVHCRESSMARASSTSGRSHPSSAGDDPALTATLSVLVAARRADRLLRRREAAHCRSGGRESSATLPMGAAARGIRTARSCSLPIRDVAFRVAAAGGSPTPLTTVDRPGERGHLWPEFLPEGNRSCIWPTAPGPTSQPVHRRTRRPARHGSSRWHRTPPTAAATCSSRAIASWWRSRSTLIGPSRLASRSTWRTKCSSSGSWTTRPTCRSRRRVSWCFAPCAAPTRNSCGAIATKGNRP